MGRAIGDILPLAIGVAISPVPIIAIVLMLGTPRARSNGPAFTVGWLAGLTIVGTIMLLIATGNATQSPGAPATWASVLKLVFGILFLLLAVHAWRGRPKPGEEAQMPKWMQAIDTFTASKALGLGAVLSGLNPKNLALTVAAATAIAQTGISNGQEAGALAAFILIGSLTIPASKAKREWLQERPPAPKRERTASAHSPTRRPGTSSRRFRNDSAAALVLLEHHWAVPLRDAIAHAGGFRISDGFISPLDLVGIGLVSAEEADELHAHDQKGALAKSA